jgi:hypothetical protein
MPPNVLDEKISSLKFYGMYRGMVVDLQDPYLAGRIRVQVYPMLEGVDSLLLPWAVPAMPLSSGAGQGIGSFAVPALGSFVWVFFENGDIYQPVYFAEAQTATMGIPAEAAINYPFTKVLRFPSGIAISVNDTLGTIQISHPKGTITIIDTDGKFAVNAVDDIILDSVKNVNVGGLVISIVAVADVSVQAGGKISITAVGNVDVKATGNATVEAVINADVKAGGTATVEATGKTTVKSAVEVDVQAPIVNIVGAVGVNLN